MYEITTKDLLEEPGKDFKRTLSELSFEDAEKGYKKVRDAEWNRSLKYKYIDLERQQMILMGNNQNKIMKETKDEDLADLIQSQIKIDWDEIKPIIPEMSTEELVDLMIELKLYVNKTLALEIAKREDAVFYLRRLLQNGRHWRSDIWSPVHAIHILALIKREDETLEPYSRSRGITALAVLARKYPAHKDDIKENILKLLNSTRDDEFATLIVDDIASLRDPSVMPDIHKAFQK